MIGVAPTGAVTAAGKDGVGDAIIVGTVFSLASAFSINGTFAFFDGVKTVPSVAATTGADITPVTAISEDVTGVTSADGGNSILVLLSSLLILGSTMRKSFDRDAPEISRSSTVNGGVTGTCCCWG